MDVMKGKMHSPLQSPGQLPGLSTVLKDEDIKNAIEDAGFDAKILPESSTPQNRAGGTLLGQFTIGGMTCAACVNSVEGILEALSGVKRAVVSLATSLGDVEYDPVIICKDDIVNAVEDAGFEGSLVQSSEQDKIIVEVADISGEMDVDFLKGLLSHINGIRQFYLDRKSRELEVLFDPEVISYRSLVDSIEEASGGRLKLHVKNPYSRMTSTDLEESSKMLHLFTFCLFLSIPISLIRVCPHVPLLYPFLLWRCGPFLMRDWLKWALVSILQFVIGEQFYLAAGRALRNGSTNMDVLVTLGTSASYFYSVGALLWGAVTGLWFPTYFETSAMLKTFVLLGKYLESVAKGKTSDAIKKLVELAPATALLLTKDKGGKCVVEREIDALLIQPGELLKVIPCAKVPSDGVVLWGSSHVNESMVTGESVPVPKEVNSPVIGGTMNLHGVLHIHATKVGSNIVLNQIISLVETAQIFKAPIQKFADFVSRIFVPTVVVMALLTLLGRYISGVVGVFPESWLPENSNYFVFALMFSISVAVIACPCALGLATPMAMLDNRRQEGDVEGTKSVGSPSEDAQIQFSTCHRSLSQNSSEPTWLSPKHIHHFVENFVFLSPCCDRALDLGLNYISSVLGTSFH
ncbi:hypothetical protein Nepgr_004210 [Nepenthes gracilis]|uniref:HMA domain-containing protein n=1 Tax=Nepenthes gracilis TaxID=150966 RepID=A0AAD3XF16_NEPGR|nr:hypothetical protein Nepgr_004210 [Nepenthes gracilis]